MEGTESGKATAGIEDGVDGSYHALSGLVVRHGDIIDAVTPIFTEVSFDGSLGEEKTGKRFGGDGGSETRLVKPGFLISKVEMIRGNYFGAPHVIHIQVTWRKLVQSQLDVASEEMSERIGAGNYATALREPIIYEAPERHYISDLLVPPSLRHTSGELYLTDLVAEFKPLPLLP